MTFKFIASVNIFAYHAWDSYVIILIVQQKLFSDLYLVNF